MTKLDEEMAAVLRNNPPDLSRPTFSRRFLEETIKQHRRDSSLQNMTMTNAEDRDRIFNQLFGRAPCARCTKQNAGFDPSLPLPRKRRRLS